jgi:hypothetical protein
MLLAWQFSRIQTLNARTNGSLLSYYISCPDTTVLLTQVNYTFDEHKVTEGDYVPSVDVHTEKTKLNNIW